MQISRVSLTVTILIGSASLAHADTCSFWNPFCRWNQNQQQFQDAPRVEKQFPAPAPTTSPDELKRALKEMLKQNNEPTISPDTAKITSCSPWNLICRLSRVPQEFQDAAKVEKQLPPATSNISPEPAASLNATKKALQEMLKPQQKDESFVEPYSKQTKTNPDPFGTNAHDKALQQGSNTGGNDPSVKKPDTPQPQETRTLYPCGAGSTGVCYRDASGNIIRSDQGSTFNPGSPQPKPEASRQPATAHWSLADAKKAMPAAAAAAVPQSRRVPDDSAYQQIKAIADGRPYVRVQQLQRVAYAGVSPTYRVGGISLNRAAAERMALDIDIEGVAIRDGQMVLAGARNSKTRLDAALFLTALRLACNSYDPYFSLDPVDGKAWSEQGDQATAIIWKRVAGEFNRDQGNTFAIDSFSVKQRYPELWAELAPQFPELRTRLVFRPELLRQTRFGEILYKADVLLKELTTGVSIVEPGIPLRANKVPGYVPAGERRAVRDFLTPDALKESKGHTGHRLWFDFLPDASNDAVKSRQLTDKLNLQKAPGLYPILEHRGLIGGRTPNPIQKAAFSSDEGVTDLSKVYPKMFVRRHDHASGKDIMDVDAEYERASADVNERIDLYANAYQELRDLTDIFRAYVASVKIVKENPKACGVASVPLTDGEKVSSPLPEFHPTEITLAAARYSWWDGRARYWQLISGSTVSGGISLRGKEFFGAAAVTGQTPVTVAIRQDLADGVPASAWQGKSGRQYAAFDIDAREPPRKVPIVATASDQ